MAKTTTRREALQKVAAYVAPVILTLPVLPTFASAASGDVGSMMMMLPPAMMMMGR